MFLHESQAIGPTKKADCTWAENAPYFPGETWLVDDMFIDLGTDNDIKTVIWKWEKIPAGDRKSNVFAMGGSNGTPDRSLVRINANCPSEVWGDLVSDASLRTTDIQACVSGKINTEKIVEHSQYFLGFTCPARIT
ncbi:MAG TPA: hypothetical protein VI755_01320 [Anaerolineales bacterium]|nr:hypothetical protein [Anaerolineales bacterium]